VFDEDRYWQITAVYAKAVPEDVLIRITARNAGPEPAELHILPTLWLRNRWSWGDGVPKPAIRDVSNKTGSMAIAEDEKLGAWKLVAGPDPTGRPPSLLFCDNETNVPKVFGGAVSTPYPKMASMTTSSMALQRSIPNDAGRRWPAGIASRSELERPSR
jgi:hypothetical protein